MNNQIQIAASIATIIGVLWTILFGSQLLTQVFQSFRQKVKQVKSYTITNVLLAIVVIILVAPHAFWSPTFPFIAFQSMSAQANSAHTVYYPYDKTVVINDNFANGSNIHSWEDGSDQNGVCAPTAENYVIETQQGHFTTCRAASTHFSDFTYQVQLTLLEGDKAGLIFRSDDTGQNFYYFIIGSDGSYALKIARGNRFEKTVKSGFSGAIKIDLNQPYQIAVIARGSTFELWVNETFVTTVYDTTYTSGQIGVIADSSYALTKVSVTQAEVWTW